MSELAVIPHARYLDAEATQSLHGVLRRGNFGIVTRATLRLARAPEAGRVLILEWPSDAAFFAAQTALSRLSEELPLSGGIIAMNGPRVLSTQADAPLTSPPRRATCACRPRGSRPSAGTWPRWAACWARSKADRSSPSCASPTRSMRCARRWM